MTFNIRAVIDDADLPLFEFEDADGATHQLPHMRALSARQALAAMGGELEEVLHHIAPDVADMVMDIPAFAADALVRAWMQHSGIDTDNLAGKSPGPSRSSSGTATKSKRTSPSAGSKSRSRR